MGRLAGKVCVVTAAGQGIGRASALAMHREGGRVIATDINSKTLGELADLGLETQHLNVRDAQAVSAFAAGLPETDVLFNCAGFVANGTLLDCSEEDWAFSLDLNITAMFRMCRAFVPGMVAKGGGSIVNMASAVGSIIAAPNRFVYGVTKAGVIGLTKAVAADFVTKGIRCNAVCPGTVESPAWTTACGQPATTRRRARPLSRASRWAGWRRRTRSPIWWSTWPATSPVSPPAMRM